MPDEMVPRIVIRDERDTAIILQSLALYAERMVQGVQLGNGMNIIGLAHTADLMNHVYGEAHRKLAEEYEEKTAEEFRDALDDVTVQDFIQRSQNNDQ